MKSIRIDAWQRDEKNTFLSDAAKSLVPALPCAFTNYKLSGNDGQECSVDVFTGKPAIALIPVGAPEWADEVMDRLFDDSGRPKPEAPALSCLGNSSAISVKWRQSLDKESDMGIPISQIRPVIGKVKRESTHHTKPTTTEWSGSPCPNDPDNFWIDDATGERVNAETGERTKPVVGNPITEKEAA